MRTGVPIILFVAVAGFHNAISASLEFEESNTSPEEIVFGENSTAQPDEAEYAAAHVKVTEDVLRTTYMGEKNQTDGETEKRALTDPGENTGSDESVDKDSGEDTSQQKTAHSKQTEDNVTSFDDVSEDFETY